jgi:hypothetical protein
VPTTQFEITYLAPWQSYGFMSMPSSGLVDHINVNYRTTIGRHDVWMNLILPLGNEKMSHHITDVHSLAEPKGFKPRTELGRKLLALRKRGIDEGMRLLSEDEVLEEVRRRRGEKDNNEAYIY